MTNIVGIVGWSGSGKTTLIERVVAWGVARGLRVSTLKHAHHGFDLDVPGKDSWRHRAAGAGEVLIVSDRRWALLHESEAGASPRVADLLGRLAPADLILAEGFHDQPWPKVEVHRPALGLALRAPDDPTIAAVLSDAPIGGTDRTVLPLDDIPTVGRFLLALASGGTGGCAK